MISRKLQSNRVPDVLPVFIFSCKKSDIPATAIGRDLSDEQEHKIMKKCGGITDIPRNENSRTRHFMVAAILPSISKEMIESGETNISKAYSRDYQLSPSYSKRQNENKSASVNLLDA